MYCQRTNLDECINKDSHLDHDCEMHEIPEIHESCGILQQKSSMSDRIEGYWPLDEGFYAEKVTGVSTAENMLWNMMVLIWRLYAVQAYHKSSSRNLHFIRNRSRLGSPQAYHLLKAVCFPSLVINVFRAFN